MVTAALERRSVLVDEAPFTAAEQDHPILEQVRQLLGGQRRAKLVAPDGAEIELPDAVFRALLKVVEHMRRGDSVSIVPVHRELTTQEAADLLNISRPSLLRILERGEIPFHRPGTHRRIKFGDLMAYRARQKTERQAALDELTRLSQEFGSYGVARRRAAEQPA